MLKAVNGSALFDSLPGSKLAAEFKMLVAFKIYILVRCCIFQISLSHTLWLR